MFARATLIAVLGALLLTGPAARAEDAKKPADSPPPPTAAEAVARGLDWLSRSQKEDGSWGLRHTYSVTGLGCLAHLGASDDPYLGERGKALTRGLQYLVAQQKDGLFGKQGHTWIHGQGFATLALSEAYGRAILCKTKPDMDVAALRATVQQAVGHIQANQSTSGGWWYVQGNPAGHEGSTTVCAVQALVSASNYGIEVDRAVLDKGFEYLKKCQNADGGFDYKLGDAASMKEGTAAGVATLALMNRFDYRVMLEGIRFLHGIGPAGISKERFPYYGHLYGCMGMRLFGEEMGAEKTTTPHVLAVRETLVSWQAKDGSWPQKGWMIGNGHEDGGYPTAFATLALTVPAARLSIFNRRPPKLPDPK